MLIDKKSYDTIIKAHTERVVTVKSGKTDYLGKGKVLPFSIIGGVLSEN